MAHCNTKRCGPQKHAADVQCTEVQECCRPAPSLLTAWEPDQPITIRLKQFLKVTGLGRSTAFEMWNPRSRHYDEKMPVGFRLFDSPNAPRFFFYRDVVEWLMYRAEQSRANRDAEKGVLEA